jgi:hypothetical protein
MTATCWVGEILNLLGITGIFDKPKISINCSGGMWSVKRPHMLFTFSVKTGRITALAEHVF